MRTQHPVINRDLLSNLCCYLAPKKHRRKTKFDTESIDTCAQYGALSYATPDETVFIPGTYKHLTGVTINRVAEGLKVSGYGSVGQIFQDNKKENIELIIEKCLYIPGLPIWIICPQQVAKQTGNFGDELHAEKDEVHLFFWELKFTTKFNAHSGLQTEL